VWDCRGTQHRRTHTEDVREGTCLAINLMLLYVLNSVCATVDCGCSYAKLWSK
jgi:hypothetical protein